MRDCEAIADRVQIVGDVQLVNFSVNQQDLTTRIDQHGGIVQVIPRAFDEARDYKDARRYRGLCELLRVWSRNWLRQTSSAGVGPAQVQAFGQDEELAALLSRIKNEPFGSLKIGSRLSPLDQHLGHANSEVHNYHQAELLLMGRSVLHDNDHAPRRLSASVHTAKKNLQVIHNRSKHLPKGALY
jgi:hypothetical protein